jgi:hypothetical protein
MRALIEHTARRLACLAEKFEAMQRRLNAGKA